MKPALIWISAIAVTSIAGVTLWTLQADDKKKEASGEAKDATPKDPSIVFQSGFEDQKAGPTPSDYFVVDGEWSIADLDGGKVLKLAEEPLVDGQVQLGESLKEAGGTIVAKVKTEKKRRSFPRFGVGLHGMSGFRLRLVPVQNKIELVRNEEVVASADLTWQSGQWWFLELSVTRTGEGWSVAGRAWPDGGSRPEQATIETTSTEPKFSGKASVSGTPFAGLPIFFDEIVIRKEFAGVNQSAP